MEKTISANFWTLSLDLSGGRITELKYRGETVLGSFKRIDGKTGNTHLCLPNFGSEGQEKYGLPFHGFARTVEWETVGVGHPMPDRFAMRAFIPKTASYPAELEVSQEFMLMPNAFRQAITVKNILGEPVPVNIGIHNYWKTPQGWLGATLNGEDITQKVRDNGFSPLQPSNTIVFPGGTTWHLVTQGFADAVIWTGRKDGGFDREYACIEPAAVYRPGYFGSDKSLLGERQSRTALQEIRP